MWESDTYLDQDFQLKSSGSGKKTGLEPNFRIVDGPLVKIQSHKTEELTLCWPFNSARDSACLSVAQGRPLQCRYLPHRGMWGGRKVEQVEN